MSKPNAKRWRLETVRRSYAEAVGGERIEFEVGDGQVFSVPHPMFADSDMQKDIDAAEGDAGKARILLGDQWDDFLAAGGDATSLMLLVMAVRNETQDTVQRHRPPKG